ncbi:hypothetical protein [Salsipaludibacter albus]|uniref:hypothetical protein n=1 Tax=Salsipaludibacter albus TaxID=2849650 RepID=UPI001EE4C790|nr:hypothetical protein [Salsipaludibacter albus]MBY5161448.1 hypothetical protein [Salsipaludibacter albus]
MTSTRAAALVRTELALQRRHGVVAATAAVTAAWAVVLLAVPTTVRPTLVGWILFLDVAAIGVFVVPAMTVVERGNGIPSALALTRLSPATAVAVRVAVVAVGSALAAVVVLSVPGPSRGGPVLVAVVLVSVLASLLGLVALGRQASLTTWMARLPLLAVPLLVPALVRGVGLWDAPVLALSPFTGGLDLLLGRWSWTAVAWILAWVVVLGALARRQADAVGDPSAGAAPRRSEARTRRATTTTGVRGTTWRRRAVASTLRVDRQTVLADGMVLAMLAGLPLLALAVRWLGGPGATWLATRHGLDVTPWMDLARTFVVVVHTPVMLGAVAGLAFCEDRDARVLPAVATTRASLVTLLAVRSGIVVTLATAAVAIGLPLSGGQHPLGIVGTLSTALVAGTCALVPMTVLAAVARDRVQGIALLKAITLPLYLPLAAGFVPPAWDAALLVVPTGWSVAAAWATSPGVLATATVAGIVACGAIGWLLGRRLVRTVVAPAGRHAAGRQSASRVATSWKRAP